MSLGEWRLSPYFQGTGEQSAEGGWFWAMSEKTIATSGAVLPQAGIAVLVRSTHRDSAYQVDGIVRVDRHMREDAYLTVAEVFRGEAEPGPRVFNERWNMGNGRAAPCKLSARGPPVRIGGPGSETGGSFSWKIGMRAIRGIQSETPLFFGKKRGRLDPTYNRGGCSASGNSCLICNTTQGDF